MEIGTDIEVVNRFREKPYNDRNKMFYESIFTDQEIDYCLSKKDSYPHFAARFAAKEAVAKAIGISIYEAKNIEIVSGVNGQPSVKLKIKKLKLKTKLLISLAHTKDYAIATALWLN